jgi:membrane-bound ClpP family serine protease
MATDISLLYFICIIGAMSLIVALFFIYVMDIEWPSVMLTIVSSVAFYLSANMFEDGTVTTVQTLIVNGTTTQSVSVVQNTAVSSLLQLISIIIGFWALYQIKEIIKSTGD